jgi:hypothetical protein
VLRRGLKPGEAIDTLMLLPSDDPEARVEIDYIRFLSRTARFNAAPNGVI